MVPKVGREAILDLMLNMGLVTIKFRLAQEDPGVAIANLTLADIDECDFPGYAPLTPTFPTAGLDGSNRGETLSTLMTWTAGAIVDPQTIFVIYMTYKHGADPERLVWAFYLSPTVTLAAPGEQFLRKVDWLADNLVI